MAFLLFFLLLHVIGITCRRRKKNKNATKEVWREKWNIKKGNWIKYCEEVDETLNNGRKWMDLSVKQLEKNINSNSLKQAASRNMGKQKFKNGKTKLKGWWDEVKVAIAERKKMNRTQRYLARKVKSGGKDYEKD